MSDRKLTILGIVAVCMVILAIVQSRISNKPRTTSDKPAYLIQGLDTRDIGSIVIGAGDDETTLKLRSGQFVIANKDNYPAEMKQINDLITKCLDIQTSQFVTDNPENHEALGLTEKDASNVVKFLKADASLLTGVIVGKSKETGQGSYVRLTNNDKVYIASNVPWISTGAMNYINQKIISANRDNIKSVTIKSPDGEYTLKRKDDSEDAVLDNIPAGKKLKANDSKSVLNALTDLRFTDVKKKSAETKEDLTFDRQYICRLKDSTVYTIQIAKKDDKTYVTCQAKFTDTTPVTIKKEGESEEELKKKEAKLLARDNANEFNSRHQAWIYEIADWKAKNLTKELSDLLEDEEKPKEKAEKKTAEKQEDENKPDEAEKIDKPDTADTK